MSRNIFGWLVLFILANVEFCDGSYERKVSPPIKKTTDAAALERRGVEKRITKNTTVNKVPSGENAAKGREKHRVPSRADTTVTERQTRGYSQRVPETAFKKGIKFVSIQDLPKDFMVTYFLPKGGLYESFRFLSNLFGCAGRYSSVRDEIHQCQKAVLKAKKFFDKHESELIAKRDQEIVSNIVRKTANIILFTMIRMGVDLNVERKAFCPPELYDENFAMAVAFDVLNIMLADVKKILERLELRTKYTDETNGEIMDLFAKFDDIGNFVPLKRLDEYRRSGVDLNRDWWMENYKEEDEVELGG